MLLRKLRGPPPPFGPFQLGAFGIIVNVLLALLPSLCLGVDAVPAILPVVKDNMNYSGPIFGGVLILALGHSFVRGRKTFKMPVKRYK
jgi:choline transport protein